MGDENGGIIVIRVIVPWEEESRGEGGNKYSVPPWRACAPYAEIPGYGPDCSTVLMLQCQWLQK